MVATSLSVPQSNSSEITERPSEEVEVISRKFSTELSRSSTRRVISSSISCGAAPR